MTKREVLDAINATITPNNMNGITAQSLNNVLTSMVECTPESSGDGGGEREELVLYFDITGVFAEGFTKDAIDLFIETYSLE